MAKIVYMSYSGQTRKFANKFIDDYEIYEIDPINPFVENKEKFILVVPSYEEEGVYEHVIDFLDTGDNAKNCVGVFGGGNLNFTAYGLYGITAKILSEKYSFPVLHLFEFQGSKRDVRKMREELEKIDE